MAAGRSNDPPLRIESDSSPTGKSIVATESSKNGGFRAANRGAARRGVDTT